MMMVVMMMMMIGRDFGLGTFRVGGREPRFEARWCPCHWFVMERRRRRVPWAFGPLSRPSQRHRVSFSSLLFSFFSLLFLSFFFHQQLFLPSPLFRFCFRTFLKKKKKKKERNKMRAAVLAHNSATIRVEVDTSRCVSVSVCLCVCVSTPLGDEPVNLRWHNVDETQ